MTEREYRIIRERIARLDAGYTTLLSRTSSIWRRRYEGLFAKYIADMDTVAYELETDPTAGDLARDFRDEMRAHQLAFDLDGLLTHGEAPTARITAGRPDRDGEG